MGLGLQSQEEKQMVPMSFFLKECLLGFKKKNKVIIECECRIFKLRD